MRDQKTVKDSFVSHVSMAINYKFVLIFIPSKKFSLELILH